MNQKQEEMELLAASQKLMLRRLAEDRRLNAQKITLATEGIDEELEAAFKGMADRTAAFRLEFENSIKTTPPVPKLCSTHGKPLGLDIEQSTYKSFKTITGRAEARTWTRHLAWLPCETCEMITVAKEEEAWLRGVGVPDAIIDSTLDNWHPKTPEDAAALIQIRAYAEDPRGFLFILAPGADKGLGTGNGKSHLAAAILRASRPKIGTSAIFRRQSQFLAMLRQTYKSESAPDPIRLFQTKRIAVLDEIGFSGGGRDEAPALHDVISHFYDARKPMIFTGNIAANTIDEARPILKDILGFRGFDRATEATNHIFLLTGPSERRGKRQIYLGLDGEGES